MRILTGKTALLYTLVTIMVTVLLTSCTGGAPAPRTPGSGKGENSSERAQPATLSLPYYTEGSKTIYGPFSSWVRGVDWFWCEDGKRLILTMEKDGAMQLWLLNADSKESRLLREVRGLDAMFPVWIGPDRLITLDLPKNPSDKTRVALVDFAIPETSVKIAGEFPGRAKQHAVTKDGRFMSVHVDTPQGGKIWRLDISKGLAVDLVTGLPLNDGLYPVWFSPDGMAAAMPEITSNGRATRLKIVNLLTGEIKATKFSHPLIDTVHWSNHGKYLAYKLADGTHKTVLESDFYIVLSSKVRVLDTNGLVVRDLSLPGGRRARDIAWVDDNMIVLGDLRNASETAWVARLDNGTVETAKPEQASLLGQRAADYPMSKGKSPFFDVSRRTRQDPGKAQTEELIVTPKK